MFIIVSCGLSVVSLGDLCPPVPPCSEVLASTSLTSLFFGGCTFENMDIQVSSVAKALYWASVSEVMSLVIIPIAMV